jgi:hypothetical protein
MLELAEKPGIPHEIDGNCRYITSDPVAVQRVSTCRSWTCRRWIAAL